MNWDARNFALDTSFLGTGKWEMEIFRDADEADKNATRYVREKKTVKAGERIMVTMAPGGGFVARFTR
jgi:alpha-glucosidase